MIVIERNSGKRVQYPNKDITKPLIGFTGDEKYYFIQEDERPTCDYRTHRIERTEEYLDDVKVYDHLPVYKVSYEVVQISNEEIIVNLNNAVGEHLDSQYPEWERIKHNAEITAMLVYQSIDTERKEYIESLFNWSTQCRAERDEQEADLLNGILPSFEFTDRP